MPAFRVLGRGDLEWITRPRAEGEPARHVAELTEAAGMSRVRANLWRYEPGAVGRRHRHPHQEETFVPVSGTLTMYLGEPPQRVQAGPGEVIHVAAGTALQSANHGDENLLVYVHGWPLESEHAELLDPAV
ncbi:MAG TPA: cupin domain-containing protein [Solirubrobacteraceae bacterium]|nr:cupin domain-containing protein [Solirubrobacteraceae bacterium]